MQTSSAARLPVHDVSEGSQDDSDSYAGNNCCAEPAAVATQPQGAAAALSSVSGLSGAALTHAADGEQLDDPQDGTFPAAASVASGVHATCQQHTISAHQKALSPL